MEELTIQQVREIQVKLLLFFDKWCGEHNINYSLSYNIVFFFHSNKFYLLLLFFL